MELDTQDDWKGKVRTREYSAVYKNEPELKKNE